MESSGHNLRRALRLPAATMAPTHHTRRFALKINFQFSLRRASGNLVAIFFVAFMAWLAGGKPPLEERGLSARIVNQTNKASKEKIKNPAVVLALNDTPLTNFPSLALTHPILKKPHDNFMAAAQAAGGLVKLTAVITRPPPCPGSARRAGPRRDGKRAGSHDAFSQ